MPAVGLLFDLLPDDLLVGEVAARLAVVLLHASSSKLIYRVMQVVGHLGSVDKNLGSSPGLLGQ